MRWTAPDQEVDQSGLEQRLCKKTVKQVNLTERMLRIVVVEEADKGWMMIRMARG